MKDTVWMWAMMVVGFDVPADQTQRLGNVEEFYTEEPLTLWFDWGAAATWAEAKEAQIKAAHWISKTTVDRWTFQRNAPLTYIGPVEMDADGAVLGPAKQRSRLRELAADMLDTQDAWRGAVPDGFMATWETFRRRILRLAREDEDMGTGSDTPDAALAG